MTNEPPRTMTRLLRAWHAGDREALDKLIKLAQEELRRVARNRLKGERRDHTLDSAGLVNEAYLRLVKQEQLDLSDRAHFLGVSANLMKQILIDYARKRNAEKRGGDAVRVSISGGLGGDDAGPNLEILALYQALDRLRELDPRQTEIAELRYFAGMTVEEIAEYLGIGSATVKRSWATSKAWLYRELKS